MSYARNTVEPYGEIIKLINQACVKLRDIIEDPSTPAGERTRLTGSLDSFQFEKKIVSAFEMSKHEGLPGQPRKPL